MATKKAGSKLPVRMKGRVQPTPGLRTMSEIILAGNLVGRAVLMSRLGQQYGGDRDIYEALGYPVTLTYDHFASRYERQDIARAIINRPVEATWRGAFKLVEARDAENTALETAWADLTLELALKSKFVRLDKLVGIGTYGILFLGLDDVTSPSDFGKPVNIGDRKLLYVKPFGQKNASIEKMEENAKDPRYGLPIEYKISITDPTGTTISDVSVHHTRVIHVAGELLESESAGTPRLQPVYNRLMDLEKLTGGSAEMFWRGARPGYQGRLDEGFSMSTEMLDDLKDQIDEYEHNLRRILINEGLDMKPLATQVSDPSMHIDVQIQMISSITGIPKRILTGSERGELASTQDRESWAGLIQFRREEFVTPLIVRAFVDRCIKYSVLPEPTKSYAIEWDDPFAMSSFEKAEVGKMRAGALKEFASMPAAEAIIPPDAFLELFLGFSVDQIELVNALRAEMLLEEVRDFEEPEEPVAEPEEDE